MYPKCGQHHAMGCGPGLSKMEKVNRTAASCLFLLPDCGCKVTGCHGRVFAAVSSPTTMEYTLDP